MSFILRKQKFLVFTVLFQRLVKKIENYASVNQKVTFGAKFMPQSEVYIGSYQVGQALN